MIFFFFQKSFLSTSNIKSPWGKFPSGVKCSLKTGPTPCFNIPTSGK